jgi:hypothetical protein
MTYNWYPPKNNLYINGVADSIGRYYRIDSTAAGNIGTGEKIYYYGIGDTNLIEVPYRRWSGINGGNYCTIGSGVLSPQTTRGIAFYMSETAIYAKGLLLASWLANSGFDSRAFWWIAYSI